MYKVDIVCCAYSSPLLIQRFWRTLRPEMDDGRLDARLLLFVHGKWLDVRQVCREIGQQSRVVLLDYGVNRGLARSWGDGIALAYGAERNADAIVIANDDVQWRPGDLFTLTEACATTPEDVCGVVAVGHQGVLGPHQSLGHSLFAYTRHAELRIGYPDVNLFPAYCEDQDLWYRAKRAGMHEAGVEVGAFHVGSAHVRGVYVQPDRAQAIRDQSAITHKLNREYLTRKWGAVDPTDFTWEHPFNDERFEYRISAEDRLSPYPGYDRTDQEIVAL